MAQTHCITLGQVAAVILVTLNNCGTPDANSRRAVIGDCVVSITPSANTEAPATTNLVGITGAVCKTTVTDAINNGDTLEIVLGNADPDALAILGASRALQDWAGDTAGFAIKTGSNHARFAIFFVVELEGQECAPGQDGAYAILGYPNLTGGTILPPTWENGTDVTWTISNVQALTTNSFGQGWWPIVKDANGNLRLLPPASAIEPDEGFFLIDTSVAPPPQACGSTAFDVAVYDVVPGATGVAGRFLPSFAPIPASITALQSDPNVGTTAYAALYPGGSDSAWPSGTAVQLGDGTWATWSGTAWVAGTAPSSGTTTTEPATYAYTFTDTSGLTFDGTPASPVAEGTTVSGTVAGSASAGTGLTWTPTTLSVSIGGANETTPYTGSIAADTTISFVQPGEAVAFEVTR